MSSEPRHKAQRRWPWVLALTAIAFGFAVWVFPFLYIRNLQVEATRLLQPGDPDGSTKPSELATARRIMVDFTTPYNLEQARAKEDLGLLYAKLSTCTGVEASTREVITQRAEYLGDYHRVMSLGSRQQGDRTSHRYRVVFDDRLTYYVDHQSRDKPAIGTPGGLCFSLGGGSMFIGAAWSSKVPITVPNT